MTNIYQISLTESDFPDANEMLIALKEVMDSLSIEFFMLGSIARNIWLDLHKIPPNRNTKDIDFAMKLHQQIDYLACLPHCIHITFEPFTKIDIVALWGYRVGEEANVDAQHHTLHHDLRQSRNSRYSKKCAERNY